MTTPTGPEMTESITADLARFAAAADLTNPAARAVFLRAYADGDLAERAAHIFDAAAARAVAQAPRDIPAPDPSTSLRAAYQAHRRGEADLAGTALQTATLQRVPGDEYA